MLKTIHAIPDKINTTSDRFYYADITDRLNLQRTAIKTRIKAANIKPHADENNRQAYLDAEQFEEFQRVNAWIDAGNIAGNYRGRYHQPEDNDATGDATSLTVQSERTVADVHLHDEFMRNAIDEIAMNDRLKAYAAFETYYLLNKTISDKECVELIGWKPPRTKFKEGEYIFIRAGKSHYLKDGKMLKQALWLIEKDDPHQDLRGKQNYEALKELLGGD